MSPMILIMFKFHSPSLSDFKSSFCSGGKSQIDHHGSLQLQRAPHFMDGGDADQLSSIPSDDRITLDLPPHRQSSSEPADGGTHRLCSTQHPP